MTSPRLQFYLDKAELCKIKAARATVPDTKETFLELTEQWLDLAEQVRRLERRIKFKLTTKAAVRDLPAVSLL